MGTYRWIQYGVSCGHSFTCRNSNRKPMQIRCWCKTRQIHFRRRKKTAKNYIDHRLDYTIPGAKRAMFYDGSVLYPTAKFVNYIGILGIRSVRII